MLFRVHMKCNKYIKNARESDLVVHKTHERNNRINTQLIYNIYIKLQKFFVIE